MKKYIIWVAMGMLALSGCDSFLDREPLSDLAPGTFFQNKTEMANWNAGIYDAFQKALAQKQVLYGDVRSDNVTTTSYAPDWLYMNAITPQKGEASWQYFYRVITRANVGIEKYVSIPNVLESETAPYLGQCYGMRALMYFYGTRVWGKMPLVTEVWDGSLENVNIPRASLDEVRDQIFSDIEKSIQYFTIANTSGKFYLGLDAMRALKVEADMWYKRYQEAVDDSDFFVNNDTYQLAQGEIEWKQMFEAPETSPEVIFAMDWDYEANGANNGWPGQLGASNTNNGWKMSSSIFNEFIDRLYSGEGADSRFWNTVDTVKIFYNSNRVSLTYASYEAVGIEKCIKYSTESATKEYDAANGVYKSKYDVLNTTSCEQKQVFMRLANVLLLRAEALNQLGRGEEALDIVNSIRSRSGYMKDAKQEVSVADKKAVESLILLERQLEFYGEGQRWFDLMRTDRLIEVMEPIYSERQESANVTVTGFGDEGTKYWPIYYREFESNVALKGDQNPPYTER